jgi:hypothetical protein
MYASRYIQCAACAFSTYASPRVVSLISRECKMDSIWPKAGVPQPGRKQTWRPFSFPKLDSMLLVEGPIIRAVSIERGGRLNLVRPCRLFRLSDQVVLRRPYHLADREALARLLVPWRQQGRAAPNRLSHPVDREALDRPWVPVGLDHKH